MTFEQSREETDALSHPGKSAACDGPSTTRTKSETRRALSLYSELDDGLIYSDEAKADAHLERFIYLRLQNSDLSMIDLSADEIKERVSAICHQALSSVLRDLREGGDVCRSM